MAGETQAGYFQCNDCRDKFTCRTGSVMERSHIPVRKWLLAIHLLSASKNGMSAHQLHRMLGVTYKTAWFLAHRIREAMIDDKAGPMGGYGKTVQADETYYGNTSKRAKGYEKGHSYKQKIVALVEPQGKARAVHVKRASAKSVREIFVSNVSRQSELLTDESKLCNIFGKGFASHQTVNHKVDYVSQSTNAAKNWRGRHLSQMRRTAFTALCD
jgi:hypothetical protein